MAPTKQLIVALAVSAVALASGVEPSLISLTSAAEAQPKAASGQQPQTADEWLSQMMFATRALNYRGDFIYVQDFAVEAMSIVHSAGPSGERQRVTTLSGPWREVVVTEDGTTQVNPGQQITLDPENRLRHSPFPISLPQDLTALSEYYRFELLHRGRTASRETQIVAITPKDGLRFGYRLWLDMETAMVLRAALFDQHGRIVEQLMFTRFEPDGFGTVTDRQPSLEDSSQPLAAPANPDAAPSTTLANQGSGAEGSAADAAEALALRWQLTELPAGFTKVLHNRYRTSEERVIEHFVLSDGLATVSVFLETLQSDQLLLHGPSQVGAMSIFGREIDDHQLMVMGEVPMKTVKSIAFAVSPR